MRIGIIGGGIYGCSLAYYLSRVDDFDVELYEKGSIGGVSTARSAGIVRHHYSDLVQIRLAKRGRELLEDLESRHGVESGFQQTGYLILCGETHESQFRENVALQHQANVDVDLLTPEELSDVVPGIDNDGVAVAALEQEAGFADPYLAASSFARCARDNGATIETDIEVIDVVVDGREVTAIDTTDGEKSMDYLFNAAGPWAAEIATMAGVDLPLQIYQSKVVVLESDRSYGPDLPTVSDIGLGLYAKPEPGGEFIVGGMERQSSRSPLESPHMTEDVSTSDLRWVSESLETRLPGYADARVVDTWSGPITAPPDWHQLIGRPDELENFFVVAGGSGHGFKEAPAFTESIALSVAGEDPVIDLYPYRLDRFQTGDRFESGYDEGSRG